MMLTVSVVVVLYATVNSIERLEMNLATDKSDTMSDYPFTPEDPEKYEFTLAYLSDFFMRSVMLIFIWVSPSKAKARGKKKNQRPRRSTKQRSTKKMASKQSRGSTRGTAASKASTQGTQLSNVTRKSSQGASSMDQTHAGTKDETHAGTKDETPDEENINTRAETVMEAFDVDEDVEAAEV
jgi:hypothetical protein